MIVEWTFAIVREYKRKMIPLIAALMLATGILFSHIFSATAHTEFDFLNVGQGDSELIQMKSNNHSPRVKVLIDGGPENGMVRTALSSLLPPTDTYIDLVAMTHAQADHMGGLIDVAKHYRIGAFLWTGRANDISGFYELMGILKKNNVPMVILRRGDVIKNGGSVITVVSPNIALAHNKDINNSSLVLHIASASTTALFMGDIGKSAEFELVRGGIRPVDIAKVPHHGSRASLMTNFINAIRPRIAVFEVGKNSYGHPTEEALSQYAGLGALLFRTDTQGTIRLITGERRMIQAIKK